MLVYLKLEYPWSYASLRYASLDQGILSYASLRYASLS